MNIIFPKNANNEISFNKVLVYMFYIITFITITRSLIHMFTPDGGANTIATIIKFDGTPDPNKVIYMIFTLWGLSQLLIGFIYLIIALKYKNLIPLMYLFIVLEYAMRIVIGKVLKPLSYIYMTGVAPGEIGNYVMVPLCIILFLWAIHSQKRKDNTL